MLYRAAIRAAIVFALIRRHPQNGLYFTFISLPHFFFWFSHAVVITPRCYEQTRSRRQPASNNARQRHVDHADLLLMAISRMAFHTGVNSWSELLGPCIPPGIGWRAADPCLAWRAMPPIGTCCRQEVPAEKARQAYNFIAWPWACLRGSLTRGGSSEGKYAGGCVFVSWIRSIPFPGVLHLLI
ncbi:hypothetical protein PMI16_03663 [Herbaspirillum sp. CF444]|nr:hypothetical protein PMI16_03663 [Herbaspirillum sp. CF444]